MICSSTAQPKCIFVTWLAILDKLAAYANLMKSDINVLVLWCLCGSENETICTLFVRFLRFCGIEFLDGVWFQVWPNHGMMNWSIWLPNVAQRNEGRKMYRSMLYVVVYAIWIERNKRRFKNILSFVEVVVK